MEKIRAALIFLETGGGYIVIVLATGIDMWAERRGTFLVPRHLPGN